MSWILPTRLQKAELPSGRARVVLGSKETKQRDLVNAVYRSSEKRQAWLKANKGKMREYDREYVKKNRDLINAKNRRRYKANPARRAYLTVKQRQYRAKEKQKCNAAQPATTT